MKKFKIKRPHTPEHDVLQEYKKRRLIAEFERLSLSTKPVSYHSNLESTSLAPDSIRLIKPAKKKAGEVITSSKSCEKYDPILYETIEFFRFQAYQVTIWIDWRRLLYVQWYKWYQCVRKLYSEYMDMDVDLDMDTTAEIYLGDTQWLDNEKPPGNLNTVENQEDIDMTDIW